MKLLDSIKIRGARVHNLKNISVEIPRDKFVVITGVSGSGKSSLAFDTIYAEGQRRYMESLSSYARQFLGLPDKPDVELIEGLSPAIAINQKTTNNNPRSTVGTVTEIYDYLRLLFARIGKPHCPKCGKPVKSQSVDQILEQILSLPEGTRFSLLAPIVNHQKGTHKEIFDKLSAAGFVRAKVDGEVHDLDEKFSLAKTKKHSIEVVVDRLINRGEIRSRLADSLETALKFGSGIVFVETDEKILTFSEKNACVDCGISLPEITPQLFSFNSPKGACPTCNGLGKVFDVRDFTTMYEWMLAVHDFKTTDLPEDACPACHGHRLKPEALSVTVGEKNIAQVVDLSVDACKKFFSSLELNDTDKKISAQVLKEINSRLKFLCDVGLDYLSLSRKSATLSGGESQRIRLATQIGSALTGVLYVLDEPSIGLHQHDNQKLLATLKNLRDLGNTLIVVEHDEETIRAADEIVDIGRGAGKNGGEVIAQGTADEISRVENSLTGDYLSGRKIIPVPKTRRDISQVLEFNDACKNNLKNISVKIPLKALTLITGVSGSGKSTLVEEIIYPRLKEIELEPFGISKVTMIDQDPIGRTPRSNIATYTGVADHIRKLFAATNGAKMRGYKAGRFSFNVKGGRCESCGGNGVLKIPMNFLPDVYVTCDVCKGARFNAETLEVKYKGKNISDVLNMPVDEALEFFENVPTIKRMLQVLHDVGLGYIELGQSANTFSGGEAQRVKLAYELARPLGRAANIYIMDEPTTGLHFDDVKKLIEVIQRLVERGDTVIIIEHNLDVIKNADYIIDLGPDGGDKGGEVVACGTPEEVTRVENSYTGQALKNILA
ncbi:MAG: excinuclease ABC subunit UvrA [Selenomonadaceae bacterium]|nr:excinuclease ABC subunit UvrA [Selenomonadaceae bacterium]MBQ7723885.1 excinuclease ABC subunit UvrA [Selenomonadaceae bacterium]